jgi:hypothetical protein
MLITAGGSSSRIPVSASRLKIGGPVAVELVTEDLLDESLVGRVELEQR